MGAKKSDKIDLLLRKVCLYSDEIAYRSLYYDFFAPLCVYAYRYLKDEDLCQDVIQDVYVKIWTQREELRIHTSATNFLITLVRNACLDLLRRQEVEKRWSEYEQVKDKEESYDLYTTEELRHLLNEALDKLPEKIADTFRMNRLEGKTYAQIAEEKQISVKTVEAYMTKALKFLRVELKDFLSFILFVHPF